MKAYRVKEVWLHSLLTLVLLDGAKWSAVLVVMVMVMVEVLVVTIMSQSY